MASYQTYLFDLDGTLIQTTDLIVACFEHSISSYLGGRFDREKVKRLIGLPFRKQVISHLKAVGMDPSHFDLDKIEKEHVDYQLTIWSDYIQSFKGVEKTLSCLKNDHKCLGIVTSRKRKTAHLFLKQQKLLDFFDVVVTPENTMKHKPDKEPVVFALDKLAAQRETTLYVGDSSYDVLAAQSAGVDQAFITWGTGLQEEVGLLNPTYIISEIEEILPSSKPISASR